ncbi:hypothetical protein FJY94_02815 [Candidatus Kaiserbacteria bacterium]|nr:hypothetical protein [Candidatus Kaiserbacteria bacterium]
MSDRRDRVGGAFRAAWENRTDPESLRPIAALYWRVPLTIGVVAIVALLGYGAYFFLDTLKAIEPPASAIAKRTPKLDRAQLESVLAQLAAREEAFLNRAVPAAIPPDPSI